MAEESQDLDWKIFIYLLIYLFILNKKLFNWRNRSKWIDK